MASLIVFHEVEDGQHWADAWRKGAWGPTRNVRTDRRYGSNL